MQLLQLITVGVQRAPHFNPNMNNENKLDSFLTDFFLNQPAHSVLDVGGGRNAPYSLWLAEHGADVDVIEKEGCEKGVLENPKIKCFSSDFRDWALPEKPKYDLVLLRSVLHYFPTDYVRGELLNKISSIVLPGGFIYISTMTPASEDRYFTDPKDIALALPEFSLIKDEVRTTPELSKIPGYPVHTTWKLLYQKKS